VSTRAADLHPEELPETVIPLVGLDCADCAKKLEDSIAKLDGVSEVTLSFSTGKLYLRQSGAMDNVYAMIASHGYRWDDGGAECGRATPLRIRIIYAAISAASLFLAALSNLFYPAPAKALLLVAVLSGGQVTFRRGFTAARLRQLDMNVLMTVAVGGALLIGEWWEAATVAFLFAASNALETFTTEKNRKSIRDLMANVPEVAHRLREGLPENIPVGEVVAGEEILVRPGERIPLDGMVVTGSSYVVEAAITGESMPSGKEAGDSVYAGTLNGNGSLQIQVKGTAADTTLAKIVRLVEEAQKRRAPTQQYIDQFARLYTPAVLGIAVILLIGGPLLIGGGWHPWLYRALALLIISCPCALVVSTPVTIVAALTSAARYGVLIKGGAYLEEAGRIQTFVFDKTGTLTTGRPKVHQVITFGEKPVEHVIGIAASLEIHSEHLLAEAVRDHARVNQIVLLPVTGFTSFPGKGVCGWLNGNKYFLGSLVFLSENGVTVLDEDKTVVGDTPLYLAAGREILGVLWVRDTLREESRSVMKKLRRLGISRLAMLTGDREEVAGAIASDLDLDGWTAQLLPEEKENAVRSYREKYGKVAMVGDGVNDAPALASADLGIAMGVAGSPTALDTADITLMADELGKLPYLISLSRRTIRIIRQNIILALVIKALAIILVIPGWLTLWLAILADMGASLLVTTNGMRLLTYRPDEAEGPQEE
jgi:Cd2+/Zn2+-exporting ATPase